MPLDYEDRGTVRPHHEVTEATKAQVKALVSFGISQSDIAKYLNISVSTLDRKYRHELDTGAIHANSLVASKLFKRAVEKDDLSAQIFWLKTRGGWRTADKQENNQVTSVVEMLLDKLK